MVSRAAVERSLTLEYQVCAPAIVRPPPPHPVDWARRVSGEDLDPWQCDVLEWDGSDLLMCCARQTGKTEAVSLRAAYRVRFLGLEVGCLSPSTRQSLRMFNRAKRWLTRDGVRIQTRVVLEHPGNGVSARVRSWSWSCRSAAGSRPSQATGPTFLSGVIPWTMRSWTRRP